MRPRVAAVAGLLAVTLLGVPGGIGGSPVNAAEDALFLVSAAAYSLDPAAAAVHVAIDVTATNNKPDLVEPTPNGPRTTRYFFEGASLVIHPEATGVRATTGRSRALSVTSRPREGFSILDVRFRTDLFFGQTTTFRVQYDLPGGAPRSDSAIRVGSAFATFSAWAFGDRGGVRITMPSTYSDETSGEQVRRSTADGVTTLEATEVTNVADWFVRVTANRPDALTRDVLRLASGPDVVVRAWPEDAPWRTRVGDLLRVGLPALAGMIGLDWPVTRQLEVAEVHTPLLEGYAGVFYTDEDRIEISEDLDELTIVHEASHAWFNSGLFDGRWINEGLADEYASRVLDRISVGGLSPDPVQPTDPAAVPLDQWVHPGRITDAETVARERYGYEASWTVIRDLVEEIGEERMRSVFAAADLGLIAYAGAGAREAVAGPADWRRFMDLLEEVGGSEQTDELFRRWVVASSQLAILDERAVVRAAYRELIAAGDGWQPGFPIRDRLARWDFVEASASIREATSVIATRDEIDALAARLAVTLPSSLRQAYEGSSSLGRVAELAEGQRAALAALDAADRSVAAERDVITSIGLLGEDPAARLAAAKADFEGDQSADAAAAAAAVDALIDGAAEVGRSRVLVGGAVGGTAMAVAGLGVALEVRRRRRLSASMAPVGDSIGPPVVEPTLPPSAQPGPPAAVGYPIIAVPTGPYATLGHPRSEAPALEPPAGSGRAEGGGS